MSHRLILNKSLERAVALRTKRCEQNSIEHGRVSRANRAEPNPSMAFEWNWGPTTGDAAFGLGSGPASAAVTDRVATALVESDGAGAEAVGRRTVPVTESGLCSNSRRHFTSSVTTR